MTDIYAQNWIQSFALEMTPTLVRDFDGDASKSNITPNALQYILVRVFSSPLYCRMYPIRNTIRYYTVSCTYVRIKVLQPRLIRYGFWTYQYFVSCKTVSVVSFSKYTHIERTDWNYNRFLHDKPPTVVDSSNRLQLLPGRPGSSVGNLANF